MSIFDIIAQPLSALVGGILPKPAPAKVLPTPTVPTPILPVAKAPVVAPVARETTVPAPVTPVKQAPQNIFDIISQPMSALVAPKAPLPINIPTLPPAKVPKIDTSPEGLIGPLAKLGLPQLRAYGAVGNYLAEKLGLTKGDFKPEGQFQQDLYGTDKAINLTTAGREARGASAEGKSSGILAKIDPALGFAVGSLDALDGGVLGRLGEVLNLSKDATKIIAGSKDAEEIAGVLQKEIPNISPEIAHAIAVPLTHIDDANTVNTVLNRTKFQLQELAKQKEAATAADETTKALPAAAETKPKLPDNARDMTPEQASAHADLVTVASDLKKGAITEDQAITQAKQIMDRVNPLPSTDVAAYAGHPDVTTNVLDALKGRATVSKQFISDLANKPELKQPERDLVRQTLAEYPDGKPVPVQEFADKVHSELLPLTRGSSDGRYENVALPDDQRGPIANYSEHVYQSPVKNSAGDIHFGPNSTSDAINKVQEAPGYFGHTRIEDLPSEDPEMPTYSDGTTRRVIEVQSDLYQKGRLEAERTRMQKPKNYPNSPMKEVQAPKARQAEIDKLAQYSNPSAHFRMVREEIKQAGLDGKTKIQFPTGDTAMKIEGLGEAPHWETVGMKGGDTNLNQALEHLKVGNEVYDGHSNWIITDVLGDGKFKAIPKTLAAPNTVHRLKPESGYSFLPDGRAYKEHLTETFDISGKVDTNNPIHKFYEKDLGRYLQNKYGATRVTDPQGVSWYEVKVPEGAAEKPVTAFKKAGVSEATPKTIKKIESLAGKFDLTIEQGLTEARKFFNEKEVDFLFPKNMIGYGDEKQAIGMFQRGKVFKNPLIQVIQSEGKIQSRVLYHEMFHGYFNEFIPKAEREEILKNIRANIATLPTRGKKWVGYDTPDARAEEFAADDFADFMAGRDYVKANKTLYQKIVDKVKEWVRKVTKLQSVYDRMVAGDRSYRRPTTRTLNGLGEEVKFKKFEGDLNPGEELASQTAGEKLPPETSTKGSEVQLPKTTENQALKREAVLPAPREPQTNLPGSSYEKTVPSKFNADKYVEEQVAKREDAREVGKATLRSKAKSFIAEAKAKLVDFSAPIEDTLADTVKKNNIKLPETEDIHNQIDRVLRAPVLAGQFARDNGLVDLIKKVPNIDRLDQYLIAKHALELDKKGIETGRDLEKDRALIATSPQYEPYAKTVASYSQKLLDYSEKSGLISPKLADALKERYPDYVPFQRVFTELEKTEGYGTRAIANLGSQSIIKKIEGSGREIESPIESLLSKTNDAFRQGEKNIAARMLAGYRKLPGNPFQLVELKEGEKAPHKITYLDEGDKRSFSTTKEVAEAAKALNVQQMNILGKIFALPVRVARIGITGINLPFVGANIAKDQITAFINSTEGVKSSVLNPVNFTKALFSAVKHDDLYHEVVREGGAGTSFDLSRDQVPETVERIRSQRNIPSKIKYTVRHPEELLRAVEDIIGRSEEFTRIQQYRGVKEAGLAAGKSPEEARAAGARQAREATVNFARRGEWGTVLNSAFLYLNAGIQGTRTFVRNIHDKPVQTLTKLALAAFLPVAAATVWNLNDPKRKAAYKDIAEYEKQNNIIIVPPNPTKNPDGTWNVIKIPLSQEINNIVGMVRRPIEAAHGLDPITFNDFSQAVLGSISPVAPTKGSVISAIVPQAIKPTIEAVDNKNLFTGFNEVPDSLTKLSPKNQVKPNTSGSARKIGDLLGVSPIKVEAFIKETFGGVGAQAENAVDQVLAKMGAIPPSQIGGQNVLKAIGARFNSAAGGQMDQKDMDAIAQTLMEQADTRNATKQEADTFLKKAPTMAPADLAKALGDMKAKNPVLFAKVKDEALAQAKGLTPKDKLVAQLGVDTGERAQYIIDQVGKLRSAQDKAAYLEDLKKKKLLTAAVIKQMAALLNTK